MDNGIWLCGLCSPRVDRDWAAYPPSVLRSWKLDAEQRAQARLQKRLPSDRQTVDQLTTALTGRDSDLGCMAIENIHAASEAALARKDPRIAVRSTRDHAGVHLHLYPKEDVRFTLHVPTNSAAEFRSALQELHDHGTPAQLPLTGVRISGSALLEDLGRQFASGGLLRLQTRPRPATLYVRRHDDDGRLLAAMEAQGHLRFGASSHTFDGSAFGGLVSFKLGMSRLAGSGSQDVSVGFNLDHWQEADVRVLRHFDRMFDFFFTAVEGRTFSLELEANGEHLISGSGPVSQDLGDNGPIRGHLYYLWALRILTDHFGVAVVYRPDAQVTPEHFYGAIQMAEILESMRVHGALPDGTEIAAAVRFDVDPDEFAVQVAQEGHAVRFDIESPGMMAFGQALPGWRSVVEIEPADVTATASKSVDKNRRESAREIRLRAAPNGKVRVWVHPESK